jgi:uncharacterized protein YecE (DUF72 family)
MSAKGQILVGTSGWTYDHWAGRFYPEGLSKSNWLQHYQSRFPTVELNYSFYRLPGEAAVEGWRRRAPEEFIFSVKGSRRITHFGRLDENASMVRTFRERLSELGPHLGVILWQLPPRLLRDLALLEGFVAILPGGVRHAIEFRHPSWLQADVFALLSRHGIAQVPVSSDAMPEDRTVTAGFIYVRFHGLASMGYSYPDQALRPWARYLKEAGLPAYCYFNNDIGGHAPRDAMTLIRLLGDAAPSWPDTT